MTDYAPVPTDLPDGPQDPGPAEPELPQMWWQDEDGAQLVRTVWAAHEDLFNAGISVSTKLSKPGSAVLTIAFEHYREEDDD